MKDDIAKLILRIMVGGLLLFHGIDKALHGVSFIEGMLSAHDLPAVVTYGVYIGEIVAPVMLIVGLFTSLAALIVIVNMLMAILLVHTDNLFSLTQYGAWSIEVPLFYLLTSVAIILLGPGKYSADYYIYHRET
jgi:putative oxidoreductase